MRRKSAAPPARASAPAATTYRTAAALGQTPPQITSRMEVMNGATGFSHSSAAFAVSLL